MKYKTLYVGTKKQMMDKRKDLRSTKNYTYFIKDRGKNYVLIRVSKNGIKKSKIITKRKSRNNKKYYVRADKRFLIEDVSIDTAREIYEENKDFPCYDTVILGYVDNQGYGRVMVESHRGGMEQVW